MEIVSVSKSERASESKKIKIKTKVASSPMFPQPNISRNGITEEYIPIYVHPASERYGPIRYLCLVISIPALMILQEISSVSFYTFTRPNQEQLQKNATIGPLPGIEPAALRFRCSALTNGAREAIA